MALLTEILSIITPYIYVIDLIFVAIVIFFQRKNPTSTLLWIMIIMVFHGVGFILYLIIGADLKRVKKKARVREYNEEHQKLVQSQLDILDSEENLYDDPIYNKYESLVRLNLKNSDSFLTHNNEVELFTDGTRKYAHLIDDIRNAEKCIYLEYYIFKPDSLGRMLLDELTKKAKEGVLVKVLVDGLGGRLIRKKHLKDFLAAGGKFAIFNPLLIPFFSMRINYRNHRKIAIIDNKIGYIGGFNIGSEYINRSSYFGFWNDKSIRIVGNGAISLQWRFYNDWKYTTNQEIDLAKISVENDTDKKAGIQIVSSGPDTLWPANKDCYIGMITGAKNRVFISTPYFIPDASVFDAIRLTAVSGVDVRIMVPMKRDHLLVHSAGLSFLGELLECGVRVFQYTEGFMHSKAVIVDDHLVSIGTTNMDIRSFDLNYEVNAVVYDEELNKNLTDRFIEDMSRSLELKLDEYKNRGAITVIRESISRLFSPLL